MNIKSAGKKLGAKLNALFKKDPYKIMFESNSDFCDNSRAVYDYMIKNGYDKKYKFVWCVQDKKTFKPESYMKNTKFTSFKKLKYIFSYTYHLFTSKTVIYTHYVPPFVNCKAQRVINLWHGTPLKVIKGHVHSGELFNSIISPSALCDTLLKDSFDIDDTKLLRCGYPRNDVLFTSTGAVNKLLCGKTYKKVILWMPTFRSQKGKDTTDSLVTKTGLPLIDSEDELFLLNQKLEKLDIMLIIKLHPEQNLENTKLLELNSIKMLTNEDLSALDITPYELLAECDLLLTDYSSVYFDFLPLNRPIGFIIDDIGTYEKKRGFTLENPTDYMPGDKIKTKAELFAFFEHALSSDDGYSEKRKETARLFDEFCDGQNSKRLLDILNIKP